MNEIYYTLHDFMLHNESITYLLIVPALLAITLFWCFLAAKDDE